MRSPLGRRRWGNRAGDCDDCGRAGQVCCGEARLGRYRAARTRAWFATCARRRRAALRRLRGPDRPCCRGGACDGGGGCSREVSADRRLHDVCQPTHAFCSNSGIFSEHGGSSRGKARATLLHHLNRQNRDPFCSEAFTEWAACGTDGFGSCREYGAPGQLVGPLLSPRRREILVLRPRGRRRATVAPRLRRAPVRGASDNGGACRGVSDHRCPHEVCRAQPRSRPAIASAFD
jgi:hypothetical protein